MSQSELGDLVPCDKATVSRIETGLAAPDEAFAIACDAAFPQMGGIFTRFLNDSAGWSAAFVPSFRPFTEYEAVAASLFVFEPTVMPGLLQTAAYARALLATSSIGASEADVDKWVEGRTRRQTILDEEDPPALWVARRPRVTVQVLAVREHIGVEGAVNIAEKPGALRVADDRATVVELTGRFRHLQSEALPATASRERIERLAEGWRDQVQTPDGESAATAAELMPLVWKSGSRPA